MYPWAETAAKMDDLGGNGWRDMVLWKVPVP